MAGGRKGVTVGKQAGYLLHVRGIAAVGVINMRLAGDETDFSTGDNSMHTDTSHGHEHGIPAAGRALQDHRSTEFAR